MLVEVASDCLRSVRQTINQSNFTLQQTNFANDRPYEHKTVHKSNRIEEQYWPNAVSNLAIKTKLTQQQKYK